MLIESALAIISLCAVAYIWKDYASGTTVVPTAVFAGGLSQMLGTLFGAGAQSITYSLLILAVSAFCLTSNTLAVARTLPISFVPYTSTVRLIPTTVGAHRGAGV